MNKHILKGWLYLPLDYIDVDLIKSELTVYSKFKTDMQGNVTPPMHVYDESFDNYLGIPFHAGIVFLKKHFGPDYRSQIMDRTSLGPYRINTPTKPNLEHEDAHAEQKYIVPEAIKVLRSDRACMLEAPPGAGKTTMSLAIASDIRLKTIIFVDTERLKEQWINEIQVKLGYTREQIGVIQGKTCETDKDFVVCMVKTVYKGKFQDQLKDQFGFAIFDEIHMLGAPKLFNLLGRINPYCMLAMSATIHRSDARDKAYKWFFGEDTIKANVPALPLKVIVIPYTKLNWGTNMQSKVLCVSRDKEFAKIIAKQVIKALNTGRNILVVSNHIHQLKLVYSAAVELGIDPTICGHLYGGGQKMQEIAKSQSKYFDEVMLESKVIFSTFGMINKGVSINRLDFGIDCTPRSEDEQLRGRIRRPLKNKKLPIWCTFNFTEDQMLSRFSDKKIRSYMNDPSIELVRYDIELG